MSKNTGGPAFPVEKRWAVPNERFEGMTLRDYFAAKVLSGYMATSYPAEGLKHVSVEENDAMIAQHCYALPTPCSQSVRKEKRNERISF